MEYIVKLYGKDNSDLKNTIIEFNIEDSITRYWVNNKVDFSRYFMDEINNPEKYIFNDDYSIEKEEKSLYRKLGDKYFYGNIVGVIKKTIKIKRNVFENDDGLENSEEDIYHVTLQITSRFDIDYKDGSKKKPFFLATMMMRAYGKNNLNNSIIPSDDDQFFDFLLMFVYKKKLEEACIKGYFRTYHRFEKNDDRLKGTIDISRHIKLNMGLNNGKIAYSYREKTVDNYLNHLIIEAYHYLKRKYYDLVLENMIYDSDFNNVIKMLENKIEYPKYDKRLIISKNLNPISHPFYTEYEDLRKVSLQIMRDEGISIFDGILDDTFGLLFYIPGLWEKYLEEFLVDDDYKMVTQDEIKILDDGKSTCRPDYVFYDGELPFMILDAKFKPKWGEYLYNNGGLLEDDYNKCIRDMNAINGHATGAIFPVLDLESNINNINYSHKISKYNLIDRFYTFPIRVPQNINDKYDEWLNIFTRYCENISKDIKDMIKYEKSTFNRIFELSNQINSIRLELEAN